MNDDRPAWQQHALCVLERHPVDMFFTGQGEPTEPAKAVCRRCPVREDCLDHALTPPVERFGVWGGLSERERRRLRRTRHQARQAGAA